MSVTGSPSSAAILTVDINTASAEAKLTTLEQRLGRLGVSATSNQEPAQIQSLKTRIAELEKQLTTTTAASEKLKASMSGLGQTKTQLTGINQVVNTWAHKLDESGKAMTRVHSATGRVIPVMERVRKEVELTTNAFRIQQRSAEMTGNARVRAANDLARAKNLANNLELRVIKAEELGKLREAEKAAVTLAKAKNLANNLELRVIRAEEVGKVREAEKAANSLAQAKNLANNLELRVIKAEELTKLKESEKAANALARAKNLANNLELRVIRAEELGRIKEAEKASNALARAKNLANSLELRVIKAEELAKLKESEKAANALARAKNLANNLELRVIRAEELGRIKEAEKAANALARAKNLANNLELRVIKAEEVARLKESEKAANSLARAKNLANNLELRVIRAEELGRIKEAEKAAAALARAKNLANNLELRVIRAEELGRIKDAEKAAASLAKAKNLANNLELKVIKAEEVSRVKELNKELALTAKYVAMSQASQLSSQIAARKLIDSGISPTGRYSAEAINAARAATSVSELVRQKQALAQATGNAGWETKGFTNAQNALHSALRGVGGALGALWLTYGKFVSVMIAAGVATKALKDSIVGGMDADFQSQFVAVLQAKGTPEPGLKNYIRDELISVARDSVFTVQENAEALKKLSLAGIDATKGITLLTTASNAAIFAQTSLGDATTMVLDTLNNFALYSNDVDKLGANFERVANVMAIASVTVNTSFADLAKAFTNITGVAGTFNIQVEEASALLQSLAMAGVRGQKAGTYVRNFMDDLLGAPTSQRAERRLDDLGVKRYNPALVDPGDFGVAQYVDNLTGKIKELNFVEQQRAIRDITNQRSRRVIRQELAQDISLVERTKALAGGAEGALTNLAAGLQNTAKMSIMLAQAAYNAATTQAFSGNEQLFIDLGRRAQEIFNSDAFNDFLNAGVKAIGGIANALLSLIDVFAKFHEQIKLVLGGLASLAAGGAAVLLVNKLKMWANALIVAVAAARAAVAVAQATAAATGASTLALGARAAGAGVAALGLNPVGIAVAGATAVALYTNRVQRDHQEYMRTTDGVLEAVKAQEAKLAEAIAKRDAPDRGRGLIGAATDRDWEAVVKREEAALEALRARLEKASAVAGTYYRVLVGEGFDATEAGRLSAHLARYAEQVADKYGEASEALEDFIMKQRDELNKLRGEDFFSSESLSKQYLEALPIAQEFLAATVSIENALANMGEGADRQQLVLYLAELNIELDAVEGKVLDLGEAWTLLEQVSLEKQVKEATSLANSLEQQYLKATMTEAAYRAYTYNVELAAVAQHRLAAAMWEVRAAEAGLDQGLADRFKKLAEMSEALANQLATGVAFKFSTPAQGGNRGGGRSQATNEVRDVRKAADAEYNQWMETINYSKRVVELRKNSSRINEQEYQDALDGLAAKSIELGVQREQKVQEEIRKQLGAARDASTKNRLNSLMEESIAKEAQLKLTATLEVSLINERNLENVFKLTQDYKGVLEDIAKQHQRTRDELFENRAVEVENDFIRRAGAQAVLDVTRAYRDELEKIDRLIRDTASTPSIQAVHIAARDDLVAQRGVDQDKARADAQYWAETRRSFNEGWDTAFRKFNDDATDYAAKAQSAFDTMSKGMHDGFENFFMNPTKEGFKGLLQSFLQMLQKMIAEAAAAQLTQKLLGSPGSPSGIAGMGMKFASMLIGGGGGTQAPAPVIERSFFATGGAFDTDSLKKFAKGGTFDTSNVVPFARGGAFGKGEILTSPTFFKFANGGQFRDGVAGEAGPEAALPLKRMANGKLGVEVDGAGGQTININVNVAPGTPAEVKRAAGAGAREALGAMTRMQRYG